MNIEQKIGNENEGANYEMACIGCGTGFSIHMIAHRNKRGDVCGLLVSCDNCQHKLSHMEVSVKVNDDSSKCSKCKATKPRPWAPCEKCGNKDS